MTTAPRHLAEDLKGLGIDLSQSAALAGLMEHTSAGQPRPAPTPDASIVLPAIGSRGGRDNIAEAAEAIYKATIESIDESQIDYDVEEFKRDLRQVIEARLRTEVERGASIQEATGAVSEIIEARMKRVRLRTVRVSASGKRQRVTIKRKTGAEYLAGVRSRRKNRAKIARSKRKYARTTGRRQARQRSRLDRQMGESAAQQLRNLLTESTIEASDLSDDMLGILEARERIQRIALHLADFFEANGSDEDQALVSVLDEMVESIDAGETAILEGKADVAAETKRLGVLLKGLGRAVEEFDKYEWADEAEEPEGN